MSVPLMDSSEPVATLFWSCGLRSIASPGRTMPFAVGIRVSGPWEEAMSRVAVGSALGWFFFDFPKRKDIVRLSTHSSGRKESTSDEEGGAVSWLPKGCAEKESWGLGEEKGLHGHGHMRNGDARLNCTVVVADVQKRIMGVVWKNWRGGDFSEMGLEKDRFSS